MYRRTLNVGGTGNLDRHKEADSAGTYVKEEDVEGSRTERKAKQVALMIQDRMVERARESWKGGQGTCTSETVP